MSYRVYITKTARKDLRKLEAIERRRLMDAIRALATTPRPSGTKKLNERPGWRIRVGEMRIIYEIDDEQQIVEILGAGHRRDIYRRRN